MIYKECRSSEETDRVKKFFNKHNFYRVENIAFPIITAYDVQDLVGAMATIYKPEPVAGPIWVDRERTGIYTVLRLAEHYEDAMRHLGFMSYKFAVQDQFSDFADKISRIMNIQHYAEDHRGFWFERTL